MRNIMDLTAGTLVISSCWWITGGWNKEKELWSINLFIHHYPLSHAPSACLSVSACVSVSFSALDYTEAVRSSLKAPSVDLGVWAHFPSIASPGSWERDKAAPWWYHEYWVSGNSSSVRWEGREGRRNRPKGVDKDLFVPEWWPILPGHCPGELLGVRHFSTAARCWDIEGWCGGGYWVTGIGEGWPGLPDGLRCLEGNKRASGSCLYPRQCRFCIIGEWQAPSQHCSAYWFINAKHAAVATTTTTTIIALSKWKTALLLPKKKKKNHSAEVTSGHIWSR